MKEQIPYRAAGTYVGEMYVEREADRVLMREIRNNQRYPYVVAARQSGKSSLLVHTMQALDPSEFRTALVDLSPYPLNDYTTFWKQFLSEIARSAELDRAVIDTDTPEDTFDAWLQAISGRIVIFVDEIDALIEARFRDLFFTKIRWFFNARSTNTEYHRIQFVLAGAAAPDRLIQDSARSPFNIGIEVKLEDLSLEQVRGLASRLKDGGAEVAENAVTEEIHELTSGSVYLCQFMLERLYRMAEERPHIGAAEVCEAGDAVVANAANEVHFKNIYGVIGNSESLHGDLVRLSRGEVIGEGSKQDLRIFGISDGVKPFRNQMYRRVFGAGGPLNLTVQKEASNRNTGDGTIKVSHIRDLSGRNEPQHNEDSEDPLVGHVLGGYVLRELLGSGGSSNVYLGENTYRSTYRALKVMRKEQSNRLKQRFLEEIRILEKLAHLNVVTFYRSIVDQGYLVIVLELLEGQTLRKSIDAWKLAHQVPPLEQVLEIFCQASEGVAFAHKLGAGIVHRDLKPENIFITRHGTTKVLDFGIARALDDIEREALVTAPSTPMGSVPYVPPELWKGEGGTPASDVYTLGIALFEALTLRHPFDDDNKPKKNAVAFMYAHLTGSVPKLRAYRQDIPESLEFVVMKATAKEPAERYRSALEFSQALRQVQKQLTSGIRTGEGVSGLRDRALLKRHPSTIVGIALSVITISIFFLNQILSNAKAFNDVPYVRKYLKETLASADARLEMWDDYALARLLVPRAETVMPMVDPLDAASVGSDARYIPYVRARSRRCDSEGMVFIPEGTLIIVSSGGALDERPEHVAAFCIDRTEVTVEAYQGCVATKKCTAAPTTNRWSEIGFGDQFCNASRVGREQHPINCIDWHGANAYCVTNGKRLPTDVEWQYAARGPVSSKYPWGNTPPKKDLLNACGNECIALGKSRGQAWSSMYEDDDGFPDTAPVGSFPDGKSAFGLVDVAGNVWEWTDSLYRPNYEHDFGRMRRTIRGGGWSDDDASVTRVSARAGIEPSSRFDNVGFRCAKTPDPKIDGF